MIVKDRPALPLAVCADAREEVELLSRGSTYGEKTGSVERLETHISWLFLTKRRVYKLKKPVRFDFLDYGTVQRRKRACEAEVQLNRRLAPHTYLGVMPLIRSPRGRLQLGGYGTPVDWVVVMRRLDADQSLDALIRSGRVTHQQVDQLATRLSDFYRQLPPLTIRAQEYRQRIEEHVRANHRSVLEAAGELDIEAVKRVYAGQRRVLTLTPEWLENRACDGRIVEGHGDLRPDHIYFQPGPIVIDCVEFNSELRQLDVLDELSFLAMECDIRQAGWNVPIFQSHGFGNIKFVQAAGEAAEGVIFPAGRLLVAEVLPADHPQKALLLNYKNDYEERFKEDVSTFGGHAYDAFTILAKAIEQAGTDKVKVRQAVENMQGCVGTAGVFNFSPTDHTGLALDAFEMITVKNGKFVLYNK